MRRKLSPYLAVLVLALGLVAPRPAAPQGGSDGPNPGAVTATGYSALPAAASVAVRPLDNTKLALQLKPLFEQALSARGFKAGSADAPLALNFETEIQQLGPAPGPREVRVSDPGSPSLTSDNEPRRDESQFRFGLAAADDTLRSGNRGVTSLGRLRYVLLATVDDQRTGRRLWQGEAMYDGFGAEEDVAFRAMAPILAEHVGQTVRQKGFRLD
jgi:hypothetical protein